MTSLFPASRFVRLARLVPGLALASAAGALTFACGGEVVSVGRNDQSVKKAPDGGATGDGATCSWDGTVSNDGTSTPGSGQYRVGDTFPSLDGCNSCSCTAQGIACTEMACAGGGTCSYGGKTYPVGASFPSEDGCNSCGCSEGGNVSCTEKACAPKTCKGPDGKIYQAGETFQLSCNTCGCGADGMISCTAMACNP